MKKTGFGLLKRRGTLFQAALVGDREFPTALFAAAREHFATVFGSHALTETVRVFAGAARGLVCTFHRLSC
jgi:hypothetical protein